MKILKFLSHQRRFYNTSSIKPIEVQPIEPPKSYIITNLNQPKALKENEEEWSHIYFDKTKPLSLPVVNLKEKLINTEDLVNLPHSLFNYAIRRDIIFRVFLYNKAYNARLHKWTKNVGEVSGSGKKPFKQKGTGRAPQGNKRAANMYKGGKTFASRPRDLYFPLNKKVRLFGLKSMLSYKFLDKKIIILDTVKGPDGKFLVEEILKLVNNAKSLIYDSEFQPKKQKGSLKVKSLRVKIVNERMLNVCELLQSKFLIFTKGSLEDFIKAIEKRERSYYPITRKFKLITSNKITLADKFKFDFDPNAKLNIYTPALAGSVNKILGYEKNPEILKKIMEKKYEKKVRYNERKMKKNQAEILKRTEENLLKSRKRTKVTKKAKKN